MAKQFDVAFTHVRSDSPCRERGCGIMCTHWETMPFIPQIGSIVHVRIGTDKDDTVAFKVDQVSCDRSREDDAWYAEAHCHSC